ncbi:hypothetical protein M2352_001800 [Azospirillum fermentarium]|uniref:phage head-tail connector protein n=1 Tax=Azospirillum fermentarium TaxID=1233114 RepID=UPI00222724AB|nr:phage head-tail connector protein [Azospirillum fermentarium]MCW2246209.1 hypothetical protein [Azospirillum fermentarium]
MLTVITPAVSQQLTTLAAVKTELKLSGTADDDWLSEVIDRASATIRRWCGRTFALETVRETFRLLAPTETLSLSRWPVASIVSVSETGNTLTAGDYETEDDVGFVYRLTGSDTETMDATGQRARSWWTTRPATSFPAPLARPCPRMWSGQPYCWSRQSGSPEPVTPW